MHDAVGLDNVLAAHEITMSRSLEAITPVTDVQEGSRNFPSQRALTSVARFWGFAETGLVRVTAAIARAPRSLQHVCALKCVYNNPVRPMARRRRHCEDQEGRGQRYSALNKD